MTTKKFVKAKFGFEPHTMQRFMSKLRGMDHVLRWNFYPRHHQQSVMEHTGWVTMFAHLLLTIDEQPLHQLSRRVGLTMYRRAWVLSSAISHDMEEAITGDGPYLLKKHIGEEAWANAVKAGLAELFCDCPPKVMDDLSTWCEEAKTREWGKYVKAADLFDVLKYAQDEAHLGSSRAFKRIGNEAIYLIRQLELPAADTLLAAMGCGKKRGIKVTGDISHLGEDGAVLP